MDMCVADVDVSVVYTYREPAYTRCVPDPVRGGGLWVLAHLGALWPLPSHVRRGGERAAAARRSVKCTYSILYIQHSKKEKQL